MTVFRTFFCAAALRSGAVALTCAASAGLPGTSVAMPVGAGIVETSTPRTNDLVDPIGFRGGGFARGAYGYRGGFARGGFAYRGGLARGGYGYRGGAVWRGGGIYRRGFVGGGGAWVRPGGYWWRPGAAVAAGAAIGVVGAASAAAWAGAAPGPNMCWYYKDASRTAGFWDRCS